MSTQLPHDPLWPRTGGWGTPAGEGEYDFAILGIPTSRTSLSPTNAHHTPAAIREALRRYSGHVSGVGAGAGAGAGADAAILPGSQGEAQQVVIDEVLRIVDAGDARDPDSESGEAQAAELSEQLARRAGLLVALGGDNACTVPAALGVAAAHGGIASAGLITIDAHHDLRDGRSNGAPVRRLIAAGLDGSRVVQIGIADFANSRAYRDRANELGITVVHRDELLRRPLADIAAEALQIAGSGGGAIHLDIDVDVCDRSVAPGCPASLPGGLSAHELRRFARLFAADQRVRGIDIAEVDALADAPDGRTVRLAALLVLEAAAGRAMSVAHN